MKEVKAIIRPARLHKIRDAFRHLPGFPGMNVSHVEGCSIHIGVEQHDTVKEELTDFTKKLRIEIITPDELLPDDEEPLLDELPAACTTQALPYAQDQQARQLLNRLAK